MPLLSHVTGLQMLEGSPQALSAPGHLTSHYLDTQHPRLDASKFTTAPLRKSCPELSPDPPGLTGQVKKRVG